MFGAVAAGLALTASGLATACTAGAASAARPSLSSRTAPSATTCCSLSGVAATSARSAWAVGYAGGGQQALIVHWNGVSWSTMT
jgi:hypothetical protein